MGSLKTGWACRVLAVSPSGIPPWYAAPLSTSAFRPVHAERVGDEEVADRSLERYFLRARPNRGALEQSHTDPFFAHPPTSSHWPDAALALIASRVSAMSIDSSGVAPVHA